MRQSKGSANLLLLAVLLTVTSVAIAGARSLMVYQQVTSQKNVANTAKQLLVGLNEHYIAICHASGGFDDYTLPADVDELVNRQFLPNSLYENPLGEQFTLSIRRNGNVTVMQVSAIMNSAEDASAIQSINQPGITSNIVGGGRIVLWEMVDSRKALNLQQMRMKKENDVFGGTTC